MLTLCACEKSIIQPEEEGAEEKGNLSLFITQFENTPFESLTRTAVSEVCTHLNFAIYSQDGSRVKQTNQKVGDANFGACSFQLEEGTYQVVVLAHSSNTNPTMTDPYCIKFTNSTGYSDTFLCSLDIPLGDEQVNMGLRLVRIVSLCRFVITDDVPADVKKLQFTYTGGSGAFDTSNGLGCKDSKQVVTFDATKGQKQFDLYTFLQDTEGTISLTVAALNSSGQELYTRQLEVPMTLNHITWVTGTLFTDSGNTSTDNTTISEITVDADWAGEHHITF